MKSPSRTSLVAGLLVALLAGCGGSAATRDDLGLDLTAAHTAVASSRVALEAYAQGRSTRAVTETALEDMAEQISALPPELAGVPVDTTADQRDRDRAVGAVDDAVAVVLASRDDFVRDQTTSTQRLEQTDRALTLLQHEFRSAG